jgi:hypothetical protein
MEWIGGCAYEWNISKLISTCDVCLVCAHVAAFFDADDEGADDPQKNQYIFLSLMSLRSNAHQMTKKKKMSREKWLGRKGQLKAMGIMKKRYVSMIDSII